MTYSFCLNTTKLKLSRTLYGHPNLALNLKKMYHIFKNNGLSIDKGLQTSYILSSSKLCAIRAMKTQSSLWWPIRSYGVLLCLLGQMEYFNIQ
jgi:hypothetical protein